MELDNSVVSRESIEFLEKICDSLEDAIVMVDRDGIIQMLSREYARFLGVDYDEVVGRHVTEVIENTRLHLIARKNKREFAELQSINGQNIVATRAPIVIGDQVLGAIGKILFKDTEELTEFHKKVEAMEAELSRYRTVFKFESAAKYDLDDIVTRDREVLKIKEKLVDIAKNNSNILIQGESGTGKELFAHAIYNNSKRFGRPFVKVNCSAIPYELMESELFGYEEGAFTGARKGGKIGKFEAADGGIIFLDEIGELPLNMQSKLLRVLQEKEIEKVGAVSEKKIDVRVIAVTNKDLEEMVSEGTFRLDLYYRLNVVNLYIPPLRERVGDIEILSDHLIEKISRSEYVDYKRLSNETLEFFKAYPWPGNVRELENTLERALNFVGDSQYIEPKHLPPNMLKYIEGRRINNLKAMIEKLEREEIARALLITRGNRVEAAEKLGISRTNLYKKLRDFNLDL